MLLPCEVIAFFYGHLDMAEATGIEPIPAGLESVILPLY